MEGKKKVFWLSEKFQRRTAFFAIGALILMLAVAYALKDAECEKKDSEIAKLEEQVAKFQQQWRESENTRFISRNIALLKQRSGIEVLPEQLARFDAFGLNDDLETLNFFLFEDPELYSPKTDFVRAVYKKDLLDHELSILFINKDRVLIADRYYNNELIPRFYPAHKYLLPGARMNPALWLVIDAGENSIHLEQPDFREALKQMSGFGDISDAEITLLEKYLGKNPSSWEKDLKELKEKG